MRRSYTPDVPLQPALCSLQTPANAGHCSILALAHSVIAGGAWVSILVPHLSFLRAEVLAGQSLLFFPLHGRIGLRSAVSLAVAGAAGSGQRAASAVATTASAQIVEAMGPCECHES